MALSGRRMSGNFSSAGLGDRVALAGGRNGQGGGAARGRAQLAGLAVRRLTRSVTVANRLQPSVQSRPVAQTGIRSVDASGFGAPRACCEFQIVVSDR
jgi:hypothetical protein